MKSSLYQSFPACFDVCHLQALNSYPNAPRFVGIEMSGCAIIRLSWQEGQEWDLFLSQDDMDRLAAGARDLQVDYFYGDEPYALEETEQGGTDYGKAWLDFTPEVCALILEHFRDALSRAKDSKRSLRLKFISNTLATRADFDMQPYTLLAPRVPPVRLVDKL